jgi:hypothetical protein
METERQRVRVSERAKLEVEERVDGGWAATEFHEKDGHRLEAMSGEKDIRILRRESTTT